jgi:endonuclease/exonuclease/phosphatase family metal-dependent hydrolase
MSVAGYSSVTGFCVTLSYMNLSVLTYNIRGDFWTKEATADLARIVKERGVDLVCLQEVVRHFNTEEGNHANILADLKKELVGEYEDLDFLPVQTSTFSMGTAILYRKSLMIPQGAPFYKHFAPLSARKSMEEWADQFFPPIRKVIMSEQFNIGTRSLIVYNAHLDFFGGDRRRIYQIGHMFKLWEGKREGQKVFEIIAGDFNTWMPYKLQGLYRRFGRLRGWLAKKGIHEASESVWWTHNFDSAEADAYEANGTLSLGFVGTLVRKFERFLRQKEDYIWFGGKGVELVSCERIDVNWSDHYPVLAKFTVEETVDAEH